MALVTVPGRTVRRRQPPRPAGVSAEWKAKGLVALFDTRAGIELLHNNRASNLTSTLSPAAAGMAADFSGTANQQYAHRPAYATTGALTLVVLCDVDALSSYGALIAKQATSTTYCPYELRIGDGSTDSKLGWLRGANGSYVFGTASASNLITAGDKAVRLIWRINADSTAGSAFVNGAKYDFSAGGGVPLDNGASVWIGRRSDGITQLDGRIYYVALFNRAISDAEALALTQNPWQLYAKRPKRVFVSVGAGGSTYNVSLTEAASVADTVAAIALRVGAMAEAASAADLVASALIATRAVAEAATAAAAATGTMVLPGAVAEAATATDSASTGGVTSNSITEAATASEATASSAALVGAIAETVTAADLAAALKTLQAAISEAATATDLVAGLLVATAAVAEAAAASDSASTGPQYAVSLSEAASPADALQAAAQLVGAVTEAATAGAAFSAAASLVGLITEPATASDSASAGATTYSVSLSELAAALDVITATIVSGGPEVYAAISTLRRQMFGPGTTTRPAQRTSTRRPPQ